MLSMSNLLQRVKRRFYPKLAIANEEQTVTKNLSERLYLIAPNLSVCLGSGEEILLTKLEFFNRVFIQTQDKQLHMKNSTKMSGKILRMNENIVSLM